MAKKRKTKEQKKLADQRHTFIHGYTPATPVSININHTYSNTTQTKTVSLPINAYPYLKKDLSKTTALTLGILAFQILLFLGLKNHFLTIPGLTY